jgi:hypothetical protein
MITFRIFIVQSIIILLCSIAVQAANTEGGSAESVSALVTAEHNTGSTSVEETSLTILRSLITRKDKTGIQHWADETGALEMNRTIQELSGRERRELAAIIVTSPVEGVMRTNLIDYITDIISNPLLGFYTELFADIPVNVHPGKGGGYAAGSHISIADGLLKQNGNPSTRNTLVHELFHIFNHRENGAGGISALNEGTAIWIFKTAFDDIPENEKELGLAEPAFGTIGYYRDIGIKGYPKHISLGVPTNITAKGREVYEHILMARDPSRLPLFDREKLQACFDTYFKDLNRNQDFSTYKKEFKKRLQKMRADIKNP